MKAHFGRSGNVRLATSWMEDEDKCEGVRGECNDDEKQQREFCKEKLMGIQDEKHNFEDFYCCREERLVCLGGKCRDCGDER
jgi:hypothetical protein